MVAHGGQAPVRGRGQGFDVLEVPRLLWAASLHEAAYFLYETCAELKLPNAAIALYDLHRGGLDNTPAHYLSGKAAEHWLLCAAESGHLQARFDLACQRMNAIKGLEDRKSMLAVKRLLLDALGDPEIHAKAQLQLGILLRQYGDARERVEAVGYLHGLAEYPDPGLPHALAQSLGWPGCRAAARASRAASPQSNGSIVPLRCSRAIRSSKKYRPRSVIRTVG